MTDDVIGRFIHIHCDCHCDCHCHCHCPCYCPPGGDAWATKLGVTFGRRFWHFVRSRSTPRIAWGRGFNWQRDLRSIYPRENLKTYPGDLYAARTPHMPSIGTLDQAYYFQLERTSRRLYYFVYLSFQCQSTQAPTFPPTLLLWRWRRFEAFGRQNVFSGQAGPSWLTKLPTTCVLAVPDAVIFHEGERAARPPDVLADGRNS